MDRIGTPKSTITRRDLLKLTFGGGAGLGLASTSSRRIAG